MAMILPSYRSCLSFLHVKRVKAVLPDLLSQTALNMCMILWVSIRILLIIFPGYTISEHMEEDGTYPLAIHSRRNGVHIIHCVSSFDQSDQVYSNTIDNLP
ncbi:hypothetical protein QCA50_014872 [Cerrena zonata]|uniref:Uncharacterized protein n=1 Tax=Cerrena zonata TaxID=2478898 RepID=A0AAW0FYP6_9APHY